MATHVWVQSADADLYAPATVVQQARGRVDLKVKRYVADVVSEQHIVVSSAVFEELAPLVDLAEHALAEAGQLADASLMRQPTAPALLHLLRRRFMHGHACTWIGPWLCIQSGASLAKPSPPPPAQQLEISPP